ncbi:nucleotide exchange factor GrpE [Candidatus Saccharibacteria bacterium 32-49-12]|nr:MAG: nucleotide exchange factor GrpE [Candidatus Saccharibacteria bacterium 32-49-12]
MTKSKPVKNNNQPCCESKQAVAELTADLQRTRADFENYRKRTELEKSSARQSGHEAAAIEMLPIFDTIERAISAAPSELRTNEWVKGIMGLAKQLDKAMESINLKKIDSSTGVKFNPEIHEAVQFDDEAEGDEEVIAESLRTGYLSNGRVVRPAMVKVMRK